MIDAALADEDFMSASTWPEGSTGQVVSSLINAIFDDSSRAMSMLTRSRAEFVAKLQSAVAGGWKS
jgi:hypothetical protein